MTTTWETYDKMNLTGKMELVEGKVLLLCNEFPITGVGDDVQSALLSLLDGHRVYEWASAKLSEPKPSHGNVDNTFSIIMPHLMPDAEDERALAPA